MKKRNQISKDIKNIQTLAQATLQVKIANSIKNNSPRGKLFNSELLFLVLDLSCVLALTNGYKL